MSVREQISKELHYRALKKFPRKAVKILGLDDLWQADLMILDLYSKVNSGFKYVLIVIDCFSKFVWVRKLKTKTGVEVTKQMRDILETSGRKCDNSQTDQGTEFFNSSFKSLVSKYKINHYNSYSQIKGAIIERYLL